MADEQRLTKKEYVFLLVKSVLSLLVMFAAMFLCAGSLSYWQGWTLCGFVALYTLVSFLILSGSPGLIRERMRPGPGAKRWDTAILVLFGPMSFGLVLFAAAVAGAIEVLLIVRTWLEDRMLMRELPGYADYARRVRRRLVPGVW